MKISAKEYQQIASKEKSNSLANNILLQSFEDYITSKYGILGKEEESDIIAEYKFMSTRKFRIDYFIKEKKIAIEIEGITYQGKSRHRTAVGYQRDLHKYNYIAQAGYTLYRFSYEDLKKEHYKEFF